MSSAYDDVITKGGLKLKGGEKLSKVAGGKVSKKKKKSKTDKEPSSSSSPPSSSSSAANRDRGSSADRPSSTEPVIVVAKTPAQLAFEEAQRKRQRDRIHKMASKSHKEKVDDFNKYLESLSEHNDIPKVGPG